MKQTPNPDEGPAADSTPKPEVTLENLLAACISGLQRNDGTVAEEILWEYPERAAEIRRHLERLSNIGLLQNPRVQPMPAAGRLGPFNLIQMLGGGGMGVVYLATEADLVGRHVALKLVRPELLHFPGVRERFRREIEVVARLQHPGIVPIYSVGEDSGVSYFAMERIHGCSLAEALEDLSRVDIAQLTGKDLMHTVARRAGAVSPTESPAPGSLFGGSWIEACTSIARSVAEALDHAHDRGVVHRDVKPSNVLITVDGRVMLTDFGLAVAEDSEALTNSSSQLGSLAYMPPEQLRGDPGFRHDRRCDVYSLGVTLYEALTLQSAFGCGVGAESIRQRIREGRPRAVRLLNRAVSRDVAVICAKSMDVDPARRYQRAADLAADLGRYAQRRPILARPAGPLLQLRRFSQRHPAISLAVALTAAALAILGFQQQGALHRARGARLLAEARALIGPDPDLALLLAVEGAGRQPGQVANEVLLEALDASHEVGMLEAPGALPARGYVADWSPDGRLVASGHYGCVRIWDADTRKLIREVPHAGRVHLLGFNRTGSRLHVVSHGPDLSTELDTSSWQVLVCHELAGTVLALVAPLQLVVLQTNTGASNPVSATELWNFADGRKLITLASGPGPCFRAAISPEGDHVAFVTGHADGRWVPLLDARTGELLVSLGPHDGAVWNVSFNGDGSLLAVATNSGKAWVWDLAEGRPSFLLEGHRGGVYSVSFSPCGRYLTTVSQEDATTRIWEVPAGAHSGLGVDRILPLARQVAVFRRSGNELQHTAFDPQGRNLVTSTLSGVLHLWSLKSPTTMTILEGDRTQDRFGEFNPTGSHLFTVRGDGGNSPGAGGLWDLASGASIAALSGVSETVSFLSFDQAGARIGGILSDGDTEMAMYWSGRDGSPDLSARFPIGTPDAEAIRAVAPAGGVAAVAHRDGRVTIHSAIPEPNRPDPAPVQGAPLALRFSPEADLLACLTDRSGEKELWIYSMSERHWRTRADMPASTRGLRFGQDSSRLIVYGTDAGVIEVGSGRILARLEGHEDQILGAAFSPDGRWVATASADKTARLWTLPDGALHAVIRGHERKVLDVCFPDAQRLLTASNDGTVRSWPLDPLAFARARQARELSAEERVRWLGE